ncbi:PspC domain-containing protein [Spirillospora sp. NPDC047279]|uniref:PspC domain-containing protein n=1 Tax=Spirillospora sp. NPDC047279 TaxID=3155478 RepID=UPI0033C2FC39
MAEDRSTTSPPPTSPPPSPSDYERMPRVSEGRILAGVCSGIGRATGIDPVVIRVGFGILVLTHGQGILLYIAAALFMPSGPADLAPAERLFRRRFDRAGVLSIMAAVLCLSFALTMTGGTAFGDTLAVFTVLGLVLVVSHARGVDLVAAARSFPERLQGHPLGSAAAGHAAGAGAAADRAGTGGVATATGTGTGTASAPVTERISLEKLDRDPGGLPEGMIDLAALSGAGSGGHAGTAWSPVDDDPPPARAAATVTCRPRESSPLTQITMLAALAAGAAIIPVASGYPAPQNAVIVGSVALAVIGAGLLMGGWFRARGLATVGTVLTLSLLAGTAATEIPAGARYGEIEWRPTDGTRTEQDYKVGVGSAVLDLTALPIKPGERVTINAEVLLGGLKVKLPPGARVELDARIGLGDLSVDRRTISGPRAQTTEVLLPADAKTPDPPVIALRIRGKVGDIQVDHV